MAVVFRLDQAHKAYGEQVLLADEQLALTDAQRIGVVGRNGAGKSTLLKILLGQEDLDSGTVWRDPDARIAWLRQHDPFSLEESALDFLMRDSGQPDWRCGEVAGRFAIKGERLTAPLSTLSGGWRTRVKLTAMLLAEPHLLVLDEPTNYLDLRTQLLLEDFLADWRGGALIVSHDRSFLKATCTHTLAVGQGRLTLHSGDVDDWLATRAQQRDRLEKENMAIMAKRQQLETFIIQNRANPNTAPQARSKAKQLEKLVLHEIEVDATNTRIVVPDVPRRDGPALHIDDLAIGYPDCRVAETISLSCDRGERYAVLGDNGQGKTTLLRTLAGDLTPLEGSFRWTHGADIGIYAQHVFSTLPDDQTVLAYLDAKASAGTGQKQLIRDVAGTFQFGGDAIDKQIKVLSGGERSRLVLAGLLLGEHTVLILDEPTNHLDVGSIDALASALTRYQGTLLFVTHDRTFATQVATAVLEVGDGRVRHYPDNITTWLNQAVERPATPAAIQASTKPTAPADGKRRHELDKAIRSCQRRIDKWSRAVEDVQSRLHACTEATTATSLQAELAAATGKLEQAEEEWLELSEEREALG